MNSLKLNGDSIANEFANILKKQADYSFEDAERELQQDVARAQDPGGVHDFAQAVGEAMGGTGSEEATDMFEGLLQKESPGDNMDDLDALLLSEEPLVKMDENTNMIDGAIDSFASNDNHVIQGLAKIASGLRLKGEGFAADVVQATANSISNDLRSEASKNIAITDELAKIAFELHREGEELAADMVEVTINKIAAVPGIGVGLSALLRIVKYLKKADEDTFKKLSPSKQSEVRKKIENSCLEKHPDKKSDEFKACVSKAINAASDDSKKE